MRVDSYCLDAAQAALALAARVTANAPLAVREAKACVDEAVAKGEAAGFERGKRGTRGPEAFPPPASRAPPAAPRLPRPAIFLG